MTYISYPDWGIAPKQKVGIDIDITDLAVRLGSPVSIRRSGKTLSITKFSPNLNGWELLTEDVKLSSQYFYSDSGAIKIYSTTTPLDSLDISKILPLTDENKLGLEVSFFGLYYNQYFTMSFEVEQTSRSISGLLYINLSNGNVLINTIPTTIYLPDIGMYSWFNIKTVIDIENLKFYKLYYNSEEYNLSKYNLLTGTSVINRIILKTGYKKLLPYNTLSGFLDNCIITVNDP